MKWFSQAPANIALIKYMGKLDASENTPMNASLSYTLPHLLSSVELEYVAGHQDFWEPLDIPGAFSFTLDNAAQQRYLAHLDYLKRYFKFAGCFIIRSCNNFPISSGLASSASSFAALTIGAVRAITALTSQEMPARAVLANLSRHGSGSSCRSFFAPWALWNQAEVTDIALPYEDLIHQVIIISHDVKAIASSRAHQLVSTSAHFKDRAARATTHLRELIHALRGKNWQQAFEITWQEFTDMHHLFETAHPAFSYMTPDGQRLLALLQQQWQQQQDGPLVTMDAGPNIHLLYRADQAMLADKFKRDHLVNNYDVL